MKQNRSYKFSILFLTALVLVVLPLAGCDSFQLPTEMPQQTGSVTGNPSAGPVETVLEPSSSPGDGSATAPEGSATPEPTLTPTEEPTPTPTPDPTPTPAPTPTPVPTGPWNDGDRPEVKVTRYYTTTLPDGLTKSLKYTRYPAYLNYFVVLKSSAIRELPNASAKSLKSVKLAQRYELLAQVKGTDGQSDWYRVRVADGGAVGYLPASSGSPKAFQVAKAFKRIEALKKVTDQDGTVRVSNYKNRNGRAPALPSKKEADTFGYLRDQSAPAYLAADKGSSFRYAPDGTICQMLGTVGDFVHVYIPTFDEVRYIPSKYIVGTKADQIKSLTQVAVVDRKYQNIMTFEVIDGHWAIVSLSFVSTGKTGGYSDPTPLGDYMTIEKKKPGKHGIGEFWYLHDGADPGAEELKFAGYAPYAVRFTGGAYLHGLPKSVSYTTDPVTGESKLVMPGSLVAESYGTFLGVRPESHMCVRNYSSHAKFMWQWFKVGSGAVLVIE